MTVSPLNRDFIAGFQRGSYESVRELYHLYYASLIEFAEKLTESKAAAHNIVVETYVKLFQMRSHFDSHPDIKAFLYITVRNICYTYTRAERHPHAGEPDWYLNEEENAHRFNDEAVRRKAIDALCNEVSQLPETRADIFKLFYGKRATLPAIAEELNLSAATVVKERIGAVQELRAHLHEKELFSVPLFIYFLAIACSEYC